MTLKNIGIYDPYLHILGGAEKYVLSIARCFPKSQILIFDSSPKLLKDAEKKFGVKLSNSKSISWPKRLTRIKFLKQVELLVYVTDGSLFFSPAKKNLLIIQSPAHIPANNLINKLKIRSWQNIICYSNFMKDIIKQKTGWDADVLFVPIDPPKKIASEKKDLILSVGRFFPHLHSKKQIEMVGFFKNLIVKFPKVELVLIGSVDRGGEAYFNKVQAAAKGLPVKIITDADKHELNRYYHQAKIYWHAAGYGQDLTLNPERAEHFGVSTIEAMSYGAVPLVFEGGGQKELVIDSVNGYTWQTETELLEKTIKLLTNEELSAKLAKAAISFSNNFTQEKFCLRLHEIIKQ